MAGVSWVGRRHRKEKAHAGSDPPMTTNYMPCQLSGVR